MSALRSIAKSSPSASSSSAFLSADYDSVIALLSGERTIDGDFLLASTFIRLARYDDAFAILDQSRGRRRPMAFALRAAAEMRRGRVDEAQALLDTARQMPASDRERDRLKFEAAMLAFTRGDTDAMERALVGSFGSMQQQAHELRGWLDIRRMRYESAVAHFERAAVGADDWTRYHALVAASYIAREIYRPDAMRRIEELVSHTPSPYLAPLHFEIVRSSAWFLAIQDDFGKALARLRQASTFATSEFSRIALQLDRGYIALAFGEKTCGWDDIDGALDLARRVDWKNAEREHRRYLLTLAALLADRRLFEARWCLHQYFDLQPTAGITEWSRDPRAEAFESFARGAVARSEGKTHIAHSEFARAFQIFKRVGYDWRAVLTLLARRPSTYSDVAAPEFIETTLKRYPNSWLRALVEREVKGATLPPAIAALTPMQRQVLALLVEGKKTKAIATALGRSPKTIAGHITTIFRSLHCTSRTEIQKACADLGYL